MSAFFALSTFGRRYRSIDLSASREFHRNHHEYPLQATLFIGFDSDGHRHRKLSVSRSTRGDGGGGSHQRHKQLGGQQRRTTGKGKPVYFPNTQRKIVAQLPRGVALRVAYAATECVARQSTPRAALHNRHGLQRCVSRRRIVANYLRIAALHAESLSPHSP